MDDFGEGYVDRTDLIAAIAEQSGQDIAVVTELVDALSRVLADDLASSGKVVLPGIGTITKDSMQAGDFLLIPEGGPEPCPDIPEGSRASRKGERIKNALKALDFITRNI